MGVQRGTTYESYMLKTFVEPGLMPASNVLQYQKVDEAVRDLKENRNDLVLLGQLPAQQYVTAGGVEIAGTEPQFSAVRHHGRQRRLLPESIRSTKR